MGLATSLGETTSCHTGRIEVVDVTTVVTDWVTGNKKAIHDPVCSTDGVIETKRLEPVDESTKVSRCVS